ncbi:Hypothetical protein ABZS17G119_03455 [Kosakonia cowanii]
MPQNPLFTTNLSENLFNAAILRLIAAFLASFHARQACFLLCGGGISDKIWAQSTFIDATSWTRLFWWSK